jgi:cytochrome c2
MPFVVSSAQDARDLAAYLATLRDTVRVPPVHGAEAWVDDTALVTEGAQLFAQYQCLGCHLLQGRGNAIGPTLNGVGARRPASYVMALLRDPQGVIPGTAMEDKELWDEEAQALTAYLMTLRDPVRVETNSP